MGETPVLRVASAAELKGNGLVGWRMISKRLLSLIASTEVCEVLGVDSLNVLLFHVSGPAVY